MGSVNSVSIAKIMNNGKKKVLAILTSRVMYGKERSNIEVYNLLREKRECDFSIIVNKDANGNLRDAVTDLNPHKITPPERHSKRLRLLTFAWTYIIGNIQTLWVILRTRPDLVMMNSEIDFYNLFPALLFYRGKIVYRIGDAPAFEGLSFRKYNTYVWKNYVLRRVTRMVFISQYIRNTVAAAGRETSKDVIIYNYPPTRKCMPTDEAGKYINHSTASAAIAFGFLGQVIAPKGVHHYIECALRILEKAPETLFYVAGSLTYDKPFAEKVMAMVPDKWQKNIILLGEISDIETFFGHIDVLCVPSIKQEPLGNVLVEAKKYSTPCVIYPTGGMPELVTDGVDGFICAAADADALYAQMAKYIGNKQNTISQGEAAKCSVDNLGIDRATFEGKWSAIFEEVL